MNRHDAWKLWPAEAVEMIEGLHAQVAALSEIDCRTCGNYWRCESVDCNKGSMYAATAKIVRWK